VVLGLAGPEPEVVADLREVRAGRRRDVPPDRPAGVGGLIGGRGPGAAEPRVSITPRAGEGAHGSEAPRGICWHQYRTDDRGTITDARIVPPTSQNQMTIEQDLLEFARQITDLPDEDAALRCEHLIRNYDPCISCSVHFLDFRRTSVNGKHPTPQPHHSVSPHA